jgi:phospholipase/lecithinase/hemolysin
VKFIVRLVLAISLFGFGGFSMQAAFTSLYIFGDALSATTNSPSESSPSPAGFYDGQRWSNGRVWVEVLAQRQGLTYNPTNNNSYYDHNSADLVTDIKNFTITQANAANALFIIWVCNADTFDAASVPDNSAQWTTAIKQSQANHLQIITNLYAKGVRTLILPNAVDISKIPAFNKSSSFTNVMHNGCVAYNVAFSNTINQATVLCPGLKIYTPDYFTLLNNVLTNAAYYGLTNALKGGLSIDALDALYKNPPAILNGPGTNYIFWDPQDPTAKLHEVMADVAQQIISPVQISQLTVLNGSNLLDMVNIPIGLNGFVDGSTNLMLPDWAAVQNITSTNATQSIFVPATNSSQDSLRISPDSIIPPGGGGGSNYTYTSTLQVYRLRFPYIWTWP